MIKYLFVFLSFLLSTQHSFSQSNDTSGETELKILSWNIYMLPFIIFKKSDKKDRAKDIVTELSQMDYDIILFQEAFKKNTRRVLRKGLKEEYPYIYGPANQKKLSFKTSSGLYTFSKRPLIYKDDIQFDACSGHDCLARKGAMLLEGEKNGHLFQVVSTHTNGGTIINNHQFHMIYDGLLLPYQKDGVPQIIGGDLNCPKSNPKRYNEMLSLLDAEDGPTIGLNYSNWEKTNIIDYLLLRRNNSNVEVIKREILNIGPDWTLEFQRPLRKAIGLSGHYPKTSMS